MEELPWLYLGDFNEILESSEKRGWCIRPWARMNDFREVVQRCHLVDLGFTGYAYTWDNNQEAMDNVQECLDRALATTTWSEWFARSVVTHVLFSSSDHLPILVTLRQQQPRRRR
jgi:endonuclease/exonuclease/phosphatase family metal-dependent hydrolase